MLRVLDLFSGIGGMSLGLEMTGGFKTVAFCERDPYCKSILRQHWPTTPIYGDVKELHYDQPVDVVAGGYPCQPYSQAGQRRGDQDDRHLWPEMRRIVEQCRPTWVLGENVPHHIFLGLDRVLSDLEDLRYASRAFVLPACGVNAPHRRERVWVIAHADSERESDRAVHARSRTGKLANCWVREPRVGRVADGVPARVDRVKALGNAVVPQVVAKIGRAILEAHYGDA